MGLFLDLIDLDEPRTNAALELLCKADHSLDDSIWAPMDSPLVARLVELFTQRGLDRLEAFRVELQAWVTGNRFKVGERIARPAGAMERWNQSELALVKLYLEHLPPADWVLDDHMLAIDFLAQRYLPPEDLRTESEWLAVKANLMGRVQANMDGVTAKQADALLAAMPSTVAGVVDAFDASARQQAVLNFSSLRCAENVRHLSENARNAMRGIIAQHVADRELGVKGPGSSLETKLLDAFGALNRDWRRIAVTEAGESQTMGYIASLPAGTRVKRVEQYRGACGFCRQIDGRVVTVVDPSDADKDPENTVWVGKTNVGRSASPRKRVGDAFVERDPSELYWLPAGLAHPHCRGRWVPTIQDRPGDDPDFAEWMRAQLAAMPSKEPK